MIDTLDFLLAFFVTGVPLILLIISLLTVIKLKHFALVLLAISGMLFLSGLIIWAISGINVWAIFIDALTEWFQSLTL